MSKRFTATQKWDDPWFDALSDGDKLFWLFLLDKCDHAGIWDSNWRLAEYHLKRRPDITALGERVLLLPSGKVFIPKFLEFQYGELKDDNRVHCSVLALLRKEGLTENPEIKGLISHIQGPKDKDKEQDQAKAKDDVLAAFGRFWTTYPKKKAKAAALKAWMKLGADGPTVEAIIAAVSAQAGSLDWTKESGQYIPHPASWLNGRRWEDQNQSQGIHKAGYAAPIPGKYGDGGV